MTTLDARDEKGLRGFMNRGGFWRYVLALVVYLIVYLGSGRILGKVAGHFADDDLLSSVGSVFFQVTASLLVGAVVLVAAMVYLGWARELFGRQPIYRSWWMWIAPILAAIPIVLRLFGIDWGRHGVDVVCFMLGTGLLIGFVEELTYRGFAVKMIRDGGHGEWVVAALSSLAFGLSHSANLLSGQALSTVAVTVLYTFAFGVLMYLTLRTTGFLIGAMVLHGLTDPTTFLSSGGIDKVVTGSGPNALLTLAGTATSVIIVVGLVLLIFVRGKVGTRNPERSPDQSSATAGIE